MAAGLTADEDFDELADFIKTFNERSNALEDVNEQLVSLEKELTTAAVWPNNKYFPDKMAQLSRIKYNLPSSDKQVFGNYKSYNCAGQLS
ncbi:unnamed protein product, partial [marine sediment metagenome]